MHEGFGSRTIVVDYVPAASPGGGARAEPPKVSPKFELSPTRVVAQAANRAVDRPLGSPCPAVSAEDPHSAAGGVVVPPSPTGVHPGHDRVGLGPEIERGEPADPRCRGTRRAEAVGSSRRRGGGAAVAEGDRPVATGRAESFCLLCPEGQIGHLGCRSEGGAQMLCTRRAADKPGGDAAEIGNAINADLKLVLFAGWGEAVVGDRSIGRRSPGAGHRGGRRGAYGTLRWIGRTDGTIPSQ